MNEPRFGELVRRDRGAVQAIDAAKVAGVSRSFWSDVEHNRRVPSRIVASKMCGAVVGNWNEWLIAWARERLDGSFDDLRLAIEAEASCPSPVTGEAELRAALAVGLHALWEHPQSAPGMGDDACPSVAERLAALMPGGSSGGIDLTYIQSALGFVDRACARLDNHTYTADATFFGGVRDILDKARMVLNAALSSPVSSEEVK